MHHWRLRRELLTSVNAHQGMLKRGRIAVVDDLALISLCYKPHLMLQCVSVMRHLNSASSLNRLTVLDKMTSWWLVESLISLAIKRAKPQVPATATRMLVMSVRDYGDQRSVRTSRGGRERPTFMLLQSLL
jgi:hypothetical protein